MQMKYKQIILTGIVHVADMSLKVTK